MNRINDKKELGVTLLELLIAITIMSVISAMVIVVWFNLTDSYSYNASSSKAREYGRDAMSRMAREIRDAGDGPDGSSALQVADCGDRQITFYSFFNSPGAEEADASARRVQFSLSDSGNLYRRVDSDDNGEWDRQEILCKNVVNYIEETAHLPDRDLFTYVTVMPNGDRVETHDPTDSSSVVSVRIRLLVDLDPGKSPVFMDLVTSVQPRNLRQL